MIENEDSVVTSLNELRKLKNERISRQTQSRAISVGNRAAALADDPLADQLTPPPVQGLPTMGGNAPFRQNMALPFPQASGLAPAPAAFDHVPVPAPPVIQTRTSYKAAVLVSALLIGAGGAGYVKLQNDTQVLLAAKDASIKSAEEARMRSVEASAKADQQARTNLLQCEDKLKTALAAAAAAAAVVPAEAPAAPVVEKKAERPTRASRASRRVAARSARQAAASASKEKSADVPNIAKKKKLANDPLAGLGKL
jgi:hypothetical protein